MRAPPIRTVKLVELVIRVRVLRRSKMPWIAGYGEGDRLAARSSVRTRGQTVKSPAIHPLPSRLKSKGCVPYAWKRQLFTQGLSSTRALFASKTVGPMGHLRCGLGV
jgi:hypothetical protein